MMLDLKIIMTDNELVADAYSIYTAVYLGNHDNFSLARNLTYLL
jgi:hypothetical protein